MKEWGKKLLFVFTDAIVKAQNKAESKEEKSGRFRTIFMRICNWIIYLGIYLFAVVCVWGFWNVEAPNWQTWVVKIVFIAVSVAIAALMFFTQIESFKDSKKEVQNYFYNNYISFRTVCAYFTAADGVTPLTQAEKNDLLAAFDGFVASSGTDTEKFAETVNNAGYPLSNSILLKKGSDGYPDGFYEKVYAQTDGTIQIIVYDECVFAVVKENLKDKGESVYANYRSSCISDLYSGESDAKTNEYISTLTVEENGNAVNRIIDRLS